MNLEDCLPAELRGPGTKITKVRAGLSGAGVHRVEAGGRAYILKVADGDLGKWRRAVEIQRLAAAAGVAPRVVHADEARRATVSELVVDRQFFALWGDPATREQALAMMGQTVRRVHDLPIPAGAPANDPHGMLTQLWSALAGYTVPAFVGEAVRRGLDEPVPASDRPAVLSHNDANPSNLLYDGEHLLLLDWDTAAPNDPYYDLAALAVFLRMDDDTCKRLLATHDGAPVATLPARFVYDRWFIATLCGTAFLWVARNNKHPGSAVETLASAMSLADVYGLMRIGQFNVGSADGQWRYGLALIKSSTEL